MDSTLSLFCGINQTHLTLYRGSIVIIRAGTKAPMRMREAINAIFSLTSKNGESYAILNLNYNHSLN